MLLCDTVDTGVSGWGGVDYSTYYLSAFSPMYLRKGPSSLVLSEITVN